MGPESFILHDFFFSSLYSLNALNADALTKVSEQRNLNNFEATLLFIN